MQVAWGLGLSGVVGGRGIVCKNGDYSVMINFFRFSSPNLVRNFVGIGYGQFNTCVNVSLRLCQGSIITACSTGSILLACKISHKLLVIASSLW